MDRHRSLHCVIAGAVAVFVLTGLAPLRAQQQAPSDCESRRAMRVVHDASRALQSGDPALFLRLFDRKRFPDFAAIESHIVALVRQSEIASSIEILETSEGGGGCQARVDWMLQLKLQGAPAPLENRREVIQLTVVPAGEERWRITRLEPVDFFRSQGAGIIQ